MGTCWGNGESQVWRGGGGGQVKPHYLLITFAKVEWEKILSREHKLGNLIENSVWLLHSQPWKAASAGLKFSPHSSIVMICSLRFLGEITITYHYASHSVSSIKLGVSVEAFFLLLLPLLFFLSDNHVELKKTKIPGLVSIIPDSFMCNFCTRVFGYMPLGQTQKIKFKICLERKVRLHPLEINP